MSTETAAAALGHPLLDALHRSSRPDVHDLVFEREFLTRVLKGVDGSAIAIWFDPGGETLYMRYKRDLPSEQLQKDAESWKQHGLLLKLASKRGDALLVPPGWSQDEAANPTRRELLLTSALVLSGQKVVLEVFRDPAAGSVRQREADLRFLQTAAEFAADRVRAQQMALLSQSQADWKKLDRFAQQAHATLELDKTCLQIVNEAVAFLGCDRVTLAVRERKHAVVKAVSGQSEVNRRANLVRLQERLADAVMKSPTAVIVGPRVQQYEPDLDEVVHAYLEESGAKTLFAIPLRRNESAVPAGAILLEQFDERISAESIVDRASHVAAHATTAIEHALDNEQILLGSFRRRAGRALAESLRLRRLLILAVLAGIVAALAFIPMHLRMEGTGALRAQVRRGVFAPESGTVRQVPVTHGQRVHEGQTLAILENTELEVQLQQAHEELASASETLKIKESERAQRGMPELRQIQLDGEIAELTDRISHLKGRESLLQKQLDSLTLVSPIDGAIATWEPQRQLRDRPVAAGNLLLSVIDEKGPWRIELKLPEVDAGPVLEKWNAREPGQPVRVEYMLATHPQLRYPGTLEEVALRTETVDAEPVLYLTIAPDADQPPPFRDGAEVRAKIDCGEHSVGYVVFRELIEFFHSRVLFFF
jgi:biotin carboxyl carrier protein